MPICPDSTYNPPFFLSGGHLQTIVPALFRRVQLLYWNRTRIDTIDGDFIDVDFHYTSKAVKRRRVVIISHGLEGHSNRSYVKGMARILTRQGWDIAAWNNRGCSGEQNVLLQSYHCGFVDDLELVIKHCIHLGYETVSLVGFSMGGNQIVKYLGQRAKSVPEEVQAAVVFSVPCDLVETNICLEKPENRLYTKKFLQTLKKKIQEKHVQFPHKIDISRLDSIKSLREYDDVYTAPMNGFKDAQDYWKQSSCGQFVNDVRVPTLMVNAKNDPFLDKECYPVVQATANKLFYLEMPEQGGHVGFMSFRNKGVYWSEKRTLEFIEQVLGV